MGRVRYKEELKKVFIKTYIFHKLQLNSIDKLQAAQLLFVNTI